MIHIDQQARGEPNRSSSPKVDPPRRSLSPKTNPPRRSSSTNINHPKRSTSSKAYRTLRLFGPFVCICMRRGSINQVWPSTSYRGSSICICTRRGFWSRGDRTLRLFIPSSAIPIYGCTKIEANRTHRLKTIGY